MDGPGAVGGSGSVKFRLFEGDARTPLAFSRLTANLQSQRLASRLLARLQICRRPSRFEPQHREVGGGSWGARTPLSREPALKVSGRLRSVRNARRCVGRMALALGRECEGGQKRRL